MAFAVYGLRIFSIYQKGNFHLLIESEVIILFKGFFIYLSVFKKMISGIDETPWMIHSLDLQSYKWWVSRVFIKGDCHIEGTFCFSKKFLSIYFIRSPCNHFCLLNHQRRVADQGINIEHKRMTNRVSGLESTHGGKNSIAQYGLFVGEYGFEEFFIEYPCQII